jgi:hypothetical protein
MIRPFSNGTQYVDWQLNNCESCQLFDEDNIDKSCVFDQALADALFGDGTITHEVANAIGYDKESYCWKCISKVPK